MCFVQDFVEASLVDAVSADGEKKKAKKGAAGEDAKESNKLTGFIVDYKEYHTDTNVDFQLTLSEEKLRAVESKGFAKTLKLTSTIRFVFGHVLRVWRRLTRARAPVSAT